jgi:cell division protein FtsN
MTDNSSDSGYELVLDNRRLIVFFVLLILICCCFFVVGFVEGKRQGFQAGSQTAAETAAKIVSEEVKAPEHATAVADSEKAPVKENAEKQQLNWYKNVSGPEQKNAIAHAPAETASTPKAAPRKEKETAKPVVIPVPAQPVPASKASPDKATVKPAAAAASVSYTVQVGAFRQRQQVEAKAKALKAKGFDCRIEVPQTSEDLYLLKVGRFKSKAEAVEMELRLKKNGFGSFIKTN